jgi:hypothetical protein
VAGDVVRWMKEDPPSRNRCCRTEGIRNKFLVKTRRILRQRERLGWADVVEDGEDDPERFHHTNFSEKVLM